MFALMLTLAPIKLEISTIEKAIEAEASADLYFRLAKARLCDQEVDAAFLDFLQALDLTEEKTAWQLPKPLLQKYFIGEVIEKSDDPSANFLYAISLANRGDLLNFFEYYFDLYPHFKGSFLDYKTRGIIYLRLSQRAIYKKRYQESAKICIEKALELEPKDGSLYRILMSLEGDHEALLEKLVQHEVYLHRSDILPFVQKALEFNRKEIAEVIVEKGQQLYSYSRSIEAAKQLLGREP